MTYLAFIKRHAWAHVLLLLLFTVGCLLGGTDTRSGFVAFLGASAVVAYLWCARFLAYNTQLAQPRAEQKAKK